MASQEIALINLVDAISDMHEKGSVFTEEMNIVFREACHALGEEARFDISKPRKDQ
jgi:hypothetical protein